MLADLGWLGADYRNYLALGRRWLESGTTYRPDQLNGPYDAFPLVESALPPLSLYPPAAGPAFALVGLLPWPVWWILPIGIIGFAIARWRPAPWTWPLMSAAASMPETMTIVLTGGSSLWTTALVAAGLLWRWPAALILLKPSLGPFALIGARDWRWWILVGLIVGVNIVGPWQDYLAVIWNGNVTLVYSGGAALMAGAILIAWLGRTRDIPIRARSNSY